MKRYILVCLAFLLFVMPQAHAVLSLEQIFRPYEWVDLSFLYDKYGTVIDLLVYTLIFVGAAQASLGRRFPGNSGRAMSLGAGLALALGMMLAERQWGFNLASFGPAAAGMLALVMGIVIYGLLRYVGMSRSRSAAAAGLMIFLALLMVAPGLFDWLHVAAPPLDASITPLLVLSLILLFWPHGQGPVTHGALDHAYRHALGADPVRQWTRRRVGKEKKLLGRGLRPRAGRVGRKLHGVGSDLDAVEKELRQRGRDPRAVSEVVSRLEGMVPQAKQVAEVAEEMKAMLEELRQMDRSLLEEQGREGEKGQDRKERRFREREIDDERHRLDGEMKSSRLEQLLEEHAGELSRRLAMAALALREGRIEEALGWVEQSKASKRAMEELLSMIQRFEDYLLRLVRRDARIENRRQRQLSA
ncbi:MAG: hypothetical protein NTW86_25235 [Candidatus Sumerlaeota bacterium]|nr:hypothetical protein [Candidatus Sumerlaeota bacterium]